MKEPEAKTAPRRFQLNLLLAGVLVFAVACNGEDPLLEVKKLHAAGRFQDSVEPLRELLAERSDDPEVNYLYGMALTRTQEPTLALFALRKAAEDPEWLVPASIQLGVGALYTGNHDGGIDAANRALEVEPDNVDALVLRARGYVASRRFYEEALVDVDRIEELDPDNAQARTLRALSHLALENVEEAQAALEALGGEALEDEMEVDENGMLCATLAMFTFEKGEVEEAGKSWDECLAKHPAKAHVVSGAIEYYDGLQQFDRTLEIVKLALEADPENSEYRYAYAGRLRFAGRNDEAEAVLLEGTESGSDKLKARAWIDLADHMLTTEQNAKAVEAFDRSLELDPNPTPAMLFMYADTLLIAKEFDRALEVAEERITIAAHKNLVRGRVQLEQGELEAALVNFTDAVRLWPDSAEARYYTALAAEAVGDFDRAISEFRASIRAGQEATDARTRLSRLHYAEGDYGLALAISRQDLRKPFDRELSLANLTAAARVGDRVAVASNMAQQMQREDTWADAVAAVARGTHDAQGPEKAIELIRTAKDLDLSLPKNASALRALSEYLIEIDKAGAALGLLRAGLEKYPRDSRFLEIRGLLLEEVGGKLDGAKASYELAVRVSPKNAKALAALGRLAAEAGETEAALEALAKAADAGTTAGALLRYGHLLVAAGRVEEADAAFAKLVDSHPYDGVAALELAKYALGRRGADAYTLGMARRAARFGGGDEAAELLAGLEAKAAASPAKDGKAAGS